MKDLIFRLSAHFLLLWFAFALVFAGISSAEDLSRGEIPSTAYTDPRQDEIEYEYDDIDDRREGLSELIESNSSSIDSLWDAVKALNKDHIED